MMHSAFPLPSTMLQAGMLPNGFDMDLSDVSEREISPTHSDFPELTPYSSVRFSYNTLRNVLPCKKAKSTDVLLLTGRIF